MFLGKVGDFKNILCLHQDAPGSAPILLSSSIGDIWKKKFERHCSTATPLRHQSMVNACLWFNGSTNFSWWQDLELGLVTVNSGWGNSPHQSCEAEGWMVDDAGWGASETIATSPGDEEGPGPERWWQWWWTPVTTAQQEMLSEDERLGNERNRKSKLGRHIITQATTTAHYSRQKGWGFGRVTTCRTWWLPSIQVDFSFKLCVQYISPGARTVPLLLAVTPRAIWQRPHHLLTTLCQHEISSVATAKEEGMENHAAPLKCFHMKVPEPEMLVRPGHPRNASSHYLCQIPGWALGTEKRKAQSLILRNPESMGEDKTGHIKSCVC